MNGRLAPGTTGRTGSGTEANIMAAEENGLNVSVGDFVQVKIFSEYDDSRYMVKVVGYVPGISLMVSTPSTHGKPLLLRDGQLMTVRLLSGNNAYGFESTILRTSLRPFPYLHLAYPKEFESMVVRKAPRARVRVIASAINENQAAAQKDPYSIIIADLSINGAMLESGMPMGEVGDRLKIRAKLAVADVEGYLQTTGTLRNIRERRPAEGEAAVYCHGLEFEPLESAERLLLHGFVYEQIVLGNAG